MGKAIHARQARGPGAVRGMALIPALIVVSLVAALGLSMLTANLSGAKVVNFQNDEYRLTSAVESVGILATEHLWSDYLESQGGAAGTITSFRFFLTAAGIQDSGPGGAPAADEGVDLLGEVDIPGASEGNAEFDDVNVDALRVVRRDDDLATRLYVTVSASTNRGQGIVNPVLNRAIQLVYTIEPVDFAGFEYGLLANNVNCVFCHTVVDTTERYYNADPELYGSFARIKVGSLESMMLRDNWDGRPEITDWDADSFVAGTVYVRGSATDQDGVPIDDWPGLTLKSFAFDGNGHLLEDDWGEMTVADLDPAGEPPLPGENLYLDYPQNYGEMPDGNLPIEFPPPFPDDGGIDPETGLPDQTGAGNRTVDPFEFYAASLLAEGAIIAGTINVSAHDFIIDTTQEYAAALMVGNQSRLGHNTTGNVILTGTADDPVVIDGTVAIDGDVVINGYVVGEGTIIASGNIYIPTDLEYLDGKAYLEGDLPGNPTGPRTFGIAADGTKNALGLAAGGNMLLGDYLKPATYTNPGPMEIVTGDASGDWNFALSELSLFNRGEWARTQPLLPGPGEDTGDPSTWTVDNPGYVPGYVPRYYNFGPGDEIPVYNLGDIYFDAPTGTWHGDEEVPLAWDPSMISIWDPNDPSNPALYDPDTGAPLAVVSQLTPKGEWLADDMQKLAIEYFENHHEWDTPMEIDGLLYTNNAIFGIVHRNDRMKGQLLVNGALVCSDLGVLAPGRRNPGGQGSGSNPPGSPYKIGLQLNYDRRTKDMLLVINPNQVIIKRTLWNPMANVL